MQSDLRLSIFQNYTTVGRLFVEFGNPISKGSFRLQISEVQRSESKKQSECEGNMKHQGFEKFPLAYPLD